MTTHPDALALLAAILADPADDLPRLAYADWCEEQGDDARAEFIRCQIALAASDRALANHGGPGDPFPPGYLIFSKRTAVARRERELLLTHWPEWVPRLSPDRSYEVILSDRWTYGGTPAVLFRRGFVAEAHCPLGIWLANGAEIAGRHPVTRVEATDRKPHVYQPSLLPAEKWHTWFRGEHPGDALASCCLPEDVWGMLARHPEYTAYGNWADFPSPATALDALSDALIAWAKSAGR